MKFVTPSRLLVSLLVVAILVLAVGTTGLWMAGRVAKRLDAVNGGLASLQVAVEDNKKNIQDQQHGMLERLNEQSHVLNGIWLEQRLLSPRDLGNRRLDVRLFVIRDHLSQAGDPIVFIGDSITESASLPSSICGRPVVNAGIGGASVQSYPQIASELLEEMKASLVVIALGTNDASKAMPPNFREQYMQLVHLMQQHAAKIVLAGPPPLGNGHLRTYFNEDTLHRISGLIRDIAAENHFEYVDLETALGADPATIDGVHLWAGGYEPWRTAMSEAIERSLSCATR
ncbi:SGNH/GDSL hydrolase family protein [Bradyrhizobium sp. CCBAU 45384]|uniref:SGNH/GDSL hydrolase family protein n=1 Tax=Bradyrhizobium sp. CCBAU 45384 TaxID=858428 RepID=UPI00230518C0|nr:SGNH/GDSL hydrolase family protein [Bradyrhizobium sp. CCBAU 45384]MDA9408553.1 hypothetical protein [Bradyrhizobium sp. CCBAU 45384]